MLAQNSFRAPTRQVGIHETGSQGMAEAWPAENVRTSLAAVYHGLALKFAAEVGLSTRFSIKTLTTKKGTVCCCSLTNLLGFVA